MIDIIITSYNREQYLAQAIESVLQQTYTDFKLIIWDDCSTDNSLDIAYQYKKSDSRIKVVAANHQGCSKSLKQAIEIGSNKYWGCVDSDDWLDSTCLEKTVAVMKSNLSVGMVYTQYLEVDEQSKVIGLGKRCKVNYSYSLMLDWFITYHFRLIRKSVYNLIGGIDTKFVYAMDYDLCLKLSEVSEVYQLKEPLYYYRLHNNSVSQQSKQQQTYWSKQASSEAIERRKTTKH